jgi:hypothetical protein
LYRRTVAALRTALHDHPTPNDQPTMQPRIREVLDYLDDSDRVLDDALAAVPEPARARRPAPVRWSVAEILEHVGGVEERVTQMLTQRLALARADGLGAERSTAPVVPTVPLARILDRDAKLVANERSHPNLGLDWAAARDTVRSARGSLRELVQSCDGVALSELVIEHPLFGPLDFYQWVVFLGGHQRRHAAQIREASAALA